MSIKDKNYYIIDIRFKQIFFDLSEYKDKNITFLSLSPYSNFLLDKLDFSYQTFSNIISVEGFHNIVLEEYNKIEHFFLNNKEYIFVFRDLSTIITYEVYNSLLFKYLEEKKRENYNIVYITDSTPCIDENINVKFNLTDKSCIFECSSVDEVLLINNKSKYFYKINNIYYRVMSILYKKRLLNIFYDRYIKKKKYKLNLSYDNLNYIDTYKNINPIEIESDISSEKLNIFILKLKKYLIKENQLSFISNQYIQILKEFKEVILNQKIGNLVKVHPFTFLATNYSYLEILLYSKNSIPKIFMQHGSYLRENIFLKYNEIYPADINFVFNDFTKQLFESRGATQVYSVGSLSFNYPVIEKEKDYDFLYITYCTSYLYAGVQIFCDMNKPSIDGNNIYRRHESMIELFGNKFRDKKICIKIQVGVFISNMMYVPFLELSKKFKNITIEFSTPVSKLIEKSKYIISDYFSSEFINRELHYKRDIILFQGTILPFSKEIIEDMKKIFILVDSIEELEEKIVNIDKISKDRKRYDDIIEYYSSKNCDTKRIVENILKKELKLQDNR